MCVQKIELISTQPQFCTSLKRYASFVSLYGHDGMRLGESVGGLVGGWGVHSAEEEMCHNKRKQIFALWHRAKNSSHIKKETGGGRGFVLVFGMQM